MNHKRLSDDALYEYLYQSGVNECSIPKKRKDRIAMSKKYVGQFRSQRHA